VTDEKAESRSFGAGAKILSIGIASTGLVTFAYFTVASHALGGDSRYDSIALLWSILFVIVSVIYRPIEQLLSRTIADRRARGISGHPLRTPLLIQASFAAIFLAVAIPLKDQIISSVFAGESIFYWILVGSTLAYAGSYFARGWLAGHERFGLYGLLVFIEATARLLFALAVAVGIGSGAGVVAMGIFAAPCVSMLVVPAAFARREDPPHDQQAAVIPALDAAIEGGPAAEAAEEAAGDLSLRHGAKFAAAVFGVMLAEQTLLNGGVIAVTAGSGSQAVAGLVFNALLIARAPLQLFQAIQTSLLPHLANLEATGGTAAFGKAIRTTLLAIIGFAAAIALVFLVAGPTIMEILFAGSDGAYTGAGLALVAVGMGFHLASGTLNQAALARGQARLAAVAWLLSAALFVAWCAADVMPDPVTRAETGYAGATGILMALLSALYRRPRSETTAAGDQSDAPADSAISR
jgi:O-antigen/teichoic acid export membrane protein